MSETTSEIEAAGYNAMRALLERSLSEAPTDIAQRRQFVQDTAIEASHAVSRSMIPNGYERYEHAETREFETGERRAINDWSHRHNHELKQQEIAMSYLPHELERQDLAPQEKARTAQAEKQRDTADFGFSF